MNTAADFSTAWAVAVARTRGTMADDVMDRNVDACRALINDVVSWHPETNVEHAARNALLLRIQAADWDVDLRAAAPFGVFRSSACDGY